MKTARFEIQSESELLEECGYMGITSPPEKLFYCTWNTLFDPEFIDLIGQFPIGRYFTDFHPNPLSYFVNQDIPGMGVAQFEEALRRICGVAPKQFAIEIDGHEWHERTPQQAEYDRRRERYFVAGGWTVLRFTAREVFRNPKKCVKETYRLVEPGLLEMIAFARQNWPEWNLEPEFVANWPQREDQV